MSEPLIPGGCILLARKIIESEIWEKPPLYLKVWVYLLTRAQHGGYKGLRRGQLSTSIPEIIDACQWRVGACIKRPTKDQIYQIIAWLRDPQKGRFESNAKATREQRESNAKATMITTTKATHGYLITIDNYGIYQDMGSYESNAESSAENPPSPSREQLVPPLTPNNINKNNKNGQERPLNTSSRQPKTYAEDSRPYRLAVYLHERIMDHAKGIGKAHLVEGPNLQKWADECRKIVELDKRDPHEVKAVIDWATTDSFWQANILSPKKLRQHYAELAIKMSAKRPAASVSGTGNEKHHDRNQREAEKMMEAMRREGVSGETTLLDNQ